MDKKQWAEWRAKLDDFLGIDRAKLKEQYKQGNRDFRKLRDEAWESFKEFVKDLVENLPLDKFLVLQEFVEERMKRETK